MSVGIFIIECVCIFIATIGFSVLFNVKATELIYCGIVGVTCYFIYKLLLIYYNEEFIGAVFGTFTAVIISRRLAYLRKIPAAIYIIPAIIPLAPGGTIYLTMYNVIYTDYMNVLKYFFLTLKIAGGIVIGMSIALSIPNKVFTINILKKEK